MALILQKQSEGISVSFSFDMNCVEFVITNFFPTYKSCYLSEVLVGGVDSRNFNNNFLDELSDGFSKLFFKLVIMNELKYTADDCSIAIEAFGRIPPLSDKNMEASLSDLGEALKFLGGYTGVSFDSVIAGLS